MVGNDGFVLEHLDELVEARGEEAAKTRSDPVDPVIAREGTGDDGGAEGARGVEGAAGVVDAGELGDEKGEADADGGEEGGFVLRRHVSTRRRKGSELHTFSAASMKIVHINWAVMNISMNKP